MVKDEEELHRLQRAFRKVLEAFARPGTVRRIEPTPGNSARPAGMDGYLETLVRMLVDQAVTFCVIGDASDAVTVYLAEETHARPCSAANANYVIVLPQADVGNLEDAVQKARPGTLVSPETGATVLAGCSNLAAWLERDGGGDSPFAVNSEATSFDGLQAVEVSGPGVNGTNRFLVDRAGWVVARGARHDEFPCGIEIVLVDAEGRVVAVPRSVTAAVVAEPAKGRAGAKEAC